MNSRLKGILCGVGAAVSYGMNPLGALPLYADGINTTTVLFYRYGLAVILLGLFMAVERKSFSITLKEFAILVPLGVLFALSSLTLFASFHFMDAGVASTLLFVYPVMVAIIMAIFFKERITFVTVLSILLSLSGIALLYRSGDGGVLDTTGVLLVMLSSLTYALYIVIVNKSSLRMSSLKLTFYVLLVGVLLITSCSFFGDGEARIQILTTPSMWLHASILAVFPTIVSLLLMVVAVHEIGSTPTAVIGALEPLTAVMLGVTLFGEELTLRLSVGITLILSAVILIILGNSISLNRITVVVGNFGHLLAKYWRWK
jgi:drug/metabolite transporter (DMT)-like permease